MWTDLTGQSKGAQLQEGHTPVSFCETTLTAVPSARGLGCCPLLENIVDDPELLGFLGRQEPVALKRILDLLIGPPGVLLVNLVQSALQSLDFLGVDQNVGNLALEATGRLMHHDPG